VLRHPRGCRAAAARTHGYDVSQMSVVATTCALRGTFTAASQSARDH
jgi:hypothetical protein